jgi:hypothetical protein
MVWVPEKLGWLQKSKAAYRREYAFRVLAAESRETLRTRLSEAAESIHVTFPSIVENFQCPLAKFLVAALMP